MQLEKTFTDSSTVAAMEYRPKEKALIVEFHKTGKYAYLNVPPDVWEQALNVKSIGNYVNNVLKKEYFFKKLN
jgi:hypothetical protein